MFVIGTRGPDQPNLAALPFVALKGAVASGEFPGEPPQVFLMQEATYLADRHLDLAEVKAVGLPTVAEVVAFLREHGLEVVVCRPCAEARGLTEDRLMEGARMGGAGDMAKMAKAHSVTLTF